MMHTDMEAKQGIAERLPRRLLVIRLQSLGDLVICLPYLQDIRDRHPEMQMDLIVREAFVNLPASLTMFNRVHVLKGGGSGKRQALHAMLLLPVLLWNRYDAIADLQNNRVSRFIRRALFVKLWSAFDVQGKFLAASRVRNALSGVRFKTKVPLRIDVDPAVLQKAKSLLASTGHDPSRMLVVLNPAGAFPTRNWPLRYYPEWMRQWQSIHPDTDFVMVGTPELTAKATAIREAVTNMVVLDLTGKTSASEAFAVVGLASLVISEDSGLMHMAWVQRVPTIALLGSTPHYWSAPEGPWTHCFHSGDLPCGDCYSEVCKWGDNRCLTRVTPAAVSEAANILLEGTKQ